MSLSSKLLEVQKQCPTLGFDAKNPHFNNKYVSLGKVLDVVLPLLQAEGILVMQPLGAVGYMEVPCISTRFVDTETNETLDFVCTLVLDKQTPQAMGSAITYFRRYAILSALGLVGDEDDDAESASTTTSKPQVKASF